MKQLEITMEMCIQCNICLELCIAGAITNQENVYLVDAEKCKYCKACIKMCPVSAISEV